MSLAIEGEEAIARLQPEYALEIMLLISRQGESRVDNLARAHNDALQGAPLGQINEASVRDHPSIRIEFQIEGSLIAGQCHCVGFCLVDVPPQLF